MNRKIKTGVAVGIILIVATIVGSAIWFGNKKSEHRNQRIPMPNETLICPTDTKQCADGSYVSRTGLNCEFASCLGENQHGQNPLSNLVISSFEQWKTYQDKKIGITLKYPPELYLKNSDRNVIFDYLSPADPLQGTEGSPLTKFEISFHEKDINKIIGEYKAEGLLDFQQRQIQLNGIPAEQITYTDAFAGGTFFITLISKNSDTIIISYAGGNEVEDTFNKMLQTVSFIER